MFTGKKAYAKYSTFSVGTESQKYKLTIGGYDGIAGEIHNYKKVDAKIKFLWNSILYTFQKTCYLCKIHGFIGNSLALHNGMKFSTKDQDHDRNSGSCAQDYHSGWWFNNCFMTNPNGKYLKTAVITEYCVNWYDFGNAYRALKKIRFMIRLK